MGNAAQYHGKRRSARNSFARRRWCSELGAIAFALVLVSLSQTQTMHHAAYGVGAFFESAPRSSIVVDRQFPLCSRYNHVDCIVDGDTIHFDGEKIRFEDFDTPETYQPRCESEAALGHAATLRLEQLMNQGPFELVKNSTRNRDVYGRLLRRIERNGQSFGAILVSEGLAHVRDGARHGWCG